MAMEWQPIATAPKDGKFIIVTEESGTWPDVVSWSDGDWKHYPSECPYGAHPAAFWLPLNVLPPLPTTSVNGSNGDTGI